MADTKTPLVSIVCITYNHEAFIRQALDSFVLQKTTFPFEIIIHDDASTDKTAAIIREYELNYPDIIVPIYQTENQYQKKEKHIWADICFPLAKGNYIAICEGDDYWTDELKLQQQVDFLEANRDFTICFHDALELNESDPGNTFNYCSMLTKNIYTASEILDYSYNVIPSCSAVFRNFDCKMLPAWFFESKFADWPLHLINLKKGNAYFINKIMGVHRIHTGGVWSGIARVNQIIYTNEILPHFTELFPQEKKKINRHISQNHLDLAKEYRMQRKYFLFIINKIKQYRYAYLK